MVDGGYEQTPVLTSGKQVPDYVFSRTCSQDISNCKIVPFVPIKLDVSSIIKKNNQTI